jgi:translation initiation factor IF-1
MDIRKIYLRCEMDYISVKEAAEKWGVTSRMVNYHCVAGRIKGAQKIGNMWVLPKDAVKPEDGRRKMETCDSISAYALKERREHR